MATLRGKIEARFVIVAALAVLALAPIAASEASGVALARATLAGEDSTASDGSEVIVECTETFSTWGACTKRWTQSGSLTYTWHQQFHSLAAYAGYSVMSWTDAEGSPVRITECHHLASTVDVGWASCDTSTWPTYATGRQTLFAYGQSGTYGESGICELACVIHGRMVLTPE